MFKLGDYLAPIDGSPQSVPWRVVGFAHDTRCSIASHSGYQMLYVGSEKPDGTRVFEQPMCASIFKLREPQ